MPFCRTLDHIALILLLLLSMDAFAYEYTPATVELFYDHQFHYLIHPDIKTLIQDRKIQVEHYQLDAAGMLQDKMTRDLSHFSGGDINEAKAKKWWSDAQQKWGPEVLRVNQGQVKAVFEYKITKYPAAVLDSRFVVYGETDFRIILKKYNEHQRKIQK